MPKLYHGIRPEKICTTITITAPDGMTQKEAFKIANDESHPRYDELVIKEEGFEVTGISKIKPSNQD